MLSQPDDSIDILETCLERLRHGESAAACLRDYPAEAQELAPLLVAAVKVRALPPPVLSPAARKAIRKQLRRAVAQQRAAGRASKPRWFAQAALRFALVVLLLMTVGLGGGVAAAQSSLPGSPLYPLKRASERARLVLATSPEQRGALHLDFADARSVEITALVVSQRPLDGAVVDDLAQEYGLAWAEIERVPAAAGAALRQRYVKSRQVDIKLFSTVLARAPGADRALLAKAVRFGEQALERASDTATPGAQPGATATPQSPALTPQPPAAKDPSTKPPHGNGNGGGNNGNNGGSNQGNGNGGGNNGNNGGSNQNNGNGNNERGGNSNVDKATPVPHATPEPGPDTHGKPGDHDNGKKDPKP
jgi:uncharacterized membrane protein YgcG